jgi:DNA helicase HerA-like ATPase
MYDGVSSAPSRAAGASVQPGQFAIRSSESAFARGKPAPLGHVVSVSGSRAVVAVDGTLQHSHGDPLSVGKLLAIESGRSWIVGLIYAAEAAGPAQPNTMLANVELQGEIRPGGADGKASFDRGIRTYPPVGAAVHEMNAGDLETIYDYSGRQTISIGKLSQDDSIEATLRVQDLLQKHFAVLGTTGCGKSSAVVLLLDRILKATDSTRVLLIDPHNEYASAFRFDAEVISPRTLSLPFWLFNFEELVDVIYRRRPGVSEEVDLLADLIPLAKTRYAQASDRNASLVRREMEDGGYTVDSPVPYRIHDVLAMIEEQLGKLDGKDDRPALRRLKSRIQSVVHDTRYQFMFSSRTIDDTMAELLRSLFRIPAEGRRITIVEMAGFPAEVVDAVVSVLCRLAFDLGVWGRGRVPLLVVAEEAHRYVPSDKHMGFGPTRRSISRIAKEGRKYGVYLGLVTQRPAELDPTILSQCSSIFAMRMANEADHAIIRSAVSDAASSTLAALPSIGNREAIAFGEAVSMPMRVRFASLPPDRLPQNQLPSLQTTLSESETSDFVDDVVRRWRSVAQRER